MNFVILFNTPHNYKRSAPGNIVY